ncbi:hypothetical protein J6590_018085 [Homalodisca vitripennis]|nr:hypothetical protein J6590_099611 [Homalodisca vitripennis]KAG8322705.1 hypothetical protein J6590_018085 [Homalodisca vitripennis]
MPRFRIKNLPPGPKGRKDEVGRGRGRRRRGAYPIKGDLPQEATKEAVAKSLGERGQAVTNIVRSYPVSISLNTVRSLSPVIAISAF